MVRSIARTLRIVVVVAVVAASACGTGDGPWLDEITPAAAASGQRVVLTGARLCGAGRATADGGCDPLPVGHVSFGIDPQVSAGIVAWRDDRVEALVPTSVPAGDVLVVVTVDGRSSNGISFRVQ